MSPKDVFLIRRIKGLGEAELPKRRLFYLIGMVGITLNGEYGIPKSAQNPNHIEAAERFMQFSFGWYANPIFVNGDYPQVMKDKVCF